MNRRDLLAGGGAAVLAALAGCVDASGLFARSAPDGVYVPDYVEGMEMVGVASLGDIRVGVTYPYPYRFWIVERDGDAYVTNRRDLEDDDTVRLMAVLWDAKTGLMVPNTGLPVEILVDVPPQVARHVGYETTFLEMPPFTLEPA